MEEPGRLQSMGSLRVGHDWATSLSLFTFIHWRRKWQPNPVFLPGESQGWGSLVGCRLWDAQSQTQLKQLSSSSSKYPNYPKQSINSVQSLSKYPWHFSQKQIILKCTWNHKKLNCQSNLEKKKSKAGGITLPDFRLYCKNYINQNIMVLAQKQTHRSMKQIREPRNKCRSLTVQFSCSVMSDSANP